MDKICSVGLLFLAVLMFFCLEISHQTTQLSQSGATDEYCLNEEFQTTCLNNEVVIVEKAIFGRMKVGRCLRDEDEELLARNRGDPKYLGCEVEVSHLIDEKCFGKNQCRFKVFDIDQQVTKPCHTNLKSYLEATYTCATVVEPDRSCTVSVTSSAQHLMTSHSSSTKLSCGSRHQPWKLEALAGQQIKVSLLDFGRAVNQGDKDCLEYGYILDREANVNVSMCATEKRNDKSKLLLQSKSNKLEIVFGNIHLNAHPSQRLQRILFRIEALGCSYFVPPDDMWLRRRNQEAVVGCYSSRQTWYLNCVNNQWLGIIGNCTREPVLSVAEITDKAPAVKNQVLVAVSIAVIGVIICVAIVVCGFICMKRYTTMMAKAGPVSNTERVHNGEWHAGSCNKIFLQQNRQLI